MVGGRWDMDPFFVAVRSRPLFAMLLPSLTYIGTSAAILVVSGPWAVSAAGWDIYVGAVIWTMILLLAAIGFVRRSNCADLRPLSTCDDTSKVLAAKFIGYFFVILAMRQLMIWQFYNPWEKLPLVFLVLFQVTIVEGARLDDLGLHGWTRRNVALAIILAAFEVVIINATLLLAYIGAYGAGIVDNLVLCGTCQLYWLSFPYQFLAVGFAEELFFRGYVYSKLRVHLGRRTGDKASFFGSMAITNAMFGLFHVPWYVGNWLVGDFSFDLEGCIFRVVGTAIMGVGLTYLYEKTASLAAPMLAHGFTNSIQPLVSFIGLFPPQVSPGYEILGYRHVIAGLILVATYLAFTRWFVRRTGGHGRAPPWVAGGGN